MRIVTVSFAALIIMLSSAFTEKKSLTVTSPEFANNGMIPVKYSCLGHIFKPCTKEKIYGFVQFV